MTKEEIIKELNVCGFEDQSVLAALDTMAKGALWMQKKMLDKACEWLNEVLHEGHINSGMDKVRLIEVFRKAMEELK